MDRSLDRSQDRSEDQAFGRDWVSAACGTHMKTKKNRAVSVEDQKDLVASVWVAFIRFPHQGCNQCNN
jgi:hypothetical protein